MDLVDSAKVLKCLAAIGSQVLDCLQLYKKKLHCFTRLIHLGVLAPAEILKDADAEAEGQRAVDTKAKAQWSVTRARDERSDPDLKSKNPRSQD